MALCQRSACGGARWTLAVKQLAMQGVRRGGPPALGMPSPVDFENHITQTRNEEKIAA